MHGYQLTFFTQQYHSHHGTPLGQWLVEESRRMGIRGATLISATEGFGHHRKIHSAHFFELVDVPFEVVMVVSQEEADRVFERFNAEGLRLFYVKTPVEFGTLGEPDSGGAG